MNTVVRSSVFCLGLIFFTNSGCGSRAYVLRPDNAKQMAERLKETDRTTVMAYDEKGKQVEIEVFAKDNIEVTSLTSQQEQWLLPGQLGDLEETDQRLTLYHRNPAVPFLAVGAGMLGGGILLGLVMDGGEAGMLSLVPIAGPITRLSSGYPDCSTAPHPCGLSRAIYLVNYLELGVEVAGLAMAMTGLFLWDSGRELETNKKKSESKLSFSFQPFLSGESGVGGMATLRF